MPILFSVLKGANVERKHYIMSEMIPRLGHRSIDKKNVYIVEAPSFTSVLNKRLIAAASKKELDILELTCYSSPSYRLPDAVNLYDYLHLMGVSRNMLQRHEPNAYPEVTDTTCAA
jgi:hypothetical protein